MIFRLTRTAKAALIVAGGAFTLSGPPSSLYATGGTTEWIYCFEDGCPNMEAFCSSRGGLQQGAYCAHEPCWGPNTGRWLEWTVEC